MREIILNGSLLAAIPLALLAGLVSFLSPCVLPLVPGYLGFVSGSSASRARLLGGAALFVAGFTTVFTLLGAAAGSVGSFLVGKTAIIERVLGVLVILLGLVMIGGLAWLQRSFKFQVTPRSGLLSALLLGFAFGIGWTPCIGPTLSAVLSLSLDSSSAARGVVLAVFYSLGIGVPFILIALGFGWAKNSVQFVKKHIRAFNIAGGALLVLLGILMATGVWASITSYLQVVFGGFNPAL